MKPKYKREFSPETWMEISNDSVEAFEWLEDEILMYQYLMLQNGINLSIDEWLKIQMAQTEKVNAGILAIIKKNKPMIVEAYEESINKAQDVALTKLEEVNPDEKPIIITDSKEAGTKGFVDDSLKILLMNHTRVTASLPAKIYSNVTSKPDHITWTMEQHLDMFHKAIETAYKKELPNMTAVNYSNGRTVSFKSYMEMAIRTEVNNVAVNMMTEGGRGLGIVFYICSTLSDSAPDHAPYQGKVYVLQDWQRLVPQDKQDKYQKLIDAKKIETLEWAKETGTYKTKTGKIYPIHLGTRPNCRHTFTPITYEQACNPNKTTQELGIHDTGKYDPDKYVQMQKQRALERKIRALKLDYNNKLTEVKTSKNEDDAVKLSAEANQLKKNVREVQSKLRDLINAHPYLTREYGRENPLKMAQNLGVK